MAADDMRRRSLRRRRFATSVAEIATTTMTTSAGERRPASSRGGMCLMALAALSTTTAAAADAPRRRSFLRSSMTRRRSLDDEDQDRPLAIVRLGGGGADRRGGDGDVVDESTSGGHLAGDERAVAASIHLANDTGDRAEEGEEERQHRDLDYRYQSESRRLQQPASASAQWYVDWMRSRCVQSCPPDPANRHCAGRAGWDAHLFDTPNYCCSAYINWMTVDECTAPSNGSTMGNSDSSGGGETDGMDALAYYGEGSTKKCPPQYSNLGDYVPFDIVTIYISETEGQVYQCVDGPLSQYCNLFSPDWSQTSGGIVHTATGALGWKLAGDCDGERLNMYDDDDDEDEDDEDDAEDEDVPMETNSGGDDEEEPPRPSNPADGGLGSRPQAGA
eukprot:CAMPEP_0181108838 /NCGR_PEP_ID=MMETSP1071-20121207/17848_1 /TAXON_ID=35127 /ORGANISM="Thalassiosira sp., Strain NH16" /LENGTH=389 /DNA_ID=CAMNT_0023192477 /DNA_START=236 /DNA_END=1401 /DNA_ORIENTATION=-